MKVITIANQKGGTGKSTIAANLACALSSDNYKVLAIDTDLQNSLSEFHLVRSDNKHIDNFTCIKIIKPVLHKEVRKFTNFDVVVIDTGGRYSQLFSSAVSSADIVIVPVTPSPYDIWASEHTFEVCEEIKSYKDNLEIFVLINMLIEKTSIAKEVDEALAKLVEKYNIKIFSTRLHNLVIYKYAIDNGLSVCEKDKNSKACEEFKLIYNEIKDLINNN